MTQTVLLGDITAFLARGAAPKYTEKKEFYVINQKCIRDWRVSLEQARFTDISAKKVSEDRTLKANDILVNSTGQGTLGRVGQFYGSEIPSTVDGHVTIVRANPELVDSVFLGYVLKSREKEIETLAEGSTGQTELSRFKLADLRLTLPDLKAQKKITEILSAIDEKIELNRRMNETLEQMGQALFRHYFTNNLEAEKWEEKSLDEIANFLNGLAMQKYPKIDEKPTLPVIKIREMSSGITANTDIANANIPEQYVVHDGDLLFSWSGTLLVKFWAEGDGALNQHLFKVTSHEYPEWLYYYWVKHHLDDFIQTAKSKATTMGHIQRRHLEQAMVRVPKAVRLEEIGNEIQPLIDAGKENAQQIQSLISLRDGLLPKLISGVIKA